METPRIRFSPDVTALISSLDDFRMKWNGRRLAPQALKKLRDEAGTASVGASLRLEGAKISDEAVDKCLADPKKAKVTGRLKQEALAYAKALDTVKNSWRDIPTSVFHFKKLHSALLGFDKKAAGKFKTRNIQLAVYRPEKDKTELFATISAAETPEKMEELCDWLYRELAEGNHHALVIIAIFIARFLAISPFAEGNGLLSRLLMNLCLMKNGYSFLPYSSLEAEIEGNSLEYQLALRQVMQNRDEGNWTYREWVVFFLRTLDRQKTALSRKIETKK